MNNMGMERGRMRKEPDNQPESSGKAAAKIARKTAAAASTFRRGDEDPYDSDSDTEHHFTYLAQDGLEDRIIMACDSTPDSPMLVHGVQPLPRSTVTLSRRPACRPAPRTISVTCRRSHGPAGNTLQTVTSL